MTVYSWPRTVLDARAIAFNRRGAVIGGPVALDGGSQVASIDAGYWVATYDVATLGTSAQIKMWRALRTLLAGGANQVQVPVADEDQAPWPGAAQASTLSAWSDGSRWSDGASWQQGTINAVVTTAAALRATSLALTVLTAGTIGGGELFSVGDRLHEIGEILTNDGAGHITVSIAPPLRAAVAAGAVCNFDAPVCRMRLASEGEMDLALGRRWQATPTVNFIESP